MFGYCSNSFLGGCPIETRYELQPCQADGITEEGLQVGDTVRVIGPECYGLVGELKVINEHNADESGDFYGVAFDDIAGYIFFRADELERVENVEEVKPVLRSVISAVRSARY